MRRTGCLDVSDVHRCTVDSDDPTDSLAKFNPGRGLFLLRRQAHCCDKLERTVAALVVKRHVETKLVRNKRE